MIKLSKSDLDFLLKQVTINYTQYTGVDANGFKVGTATNIFNYSMLANELDPSGLREVNGSNNNLVGSFDENGVFIPGSAAVADANGVYYVSGTEPGATNPNGNWGQADTDFLRIFAANTPGAAAAGTTYATQTPGGSSNNVVDGSVRLTANLITSTVIDPNSPVYNPAAATVLADTIAAGGVDAAAVDSPSAGAGGAAQIPNVGVLGGVPYNQWFVTFGQFFDHGLDFISKGGGYVLIAVSPNDPLYSGATAIPGLDGKYMLLSRATISNPASDFQLVAGTTSIMELKPGVQAQYNNSTALLIDQSQTYGSDASINAFVHEYTPEGVPTGKLIAGGVAHNQLATWADMKANALNIGVVLTDADIANAPALRVDPTGKLMFTPGATTWTTATIAGYNPANQDPSDPFQRNADGSVLRTKQAILADIAPAADPSFHYDIDPATGAEKVYVHNGISYSYDAALLDAHLVSGDGRTNENAGLGAVHHIWHEEHNYQVNNVKLGALTAALQTGNAAEINNWLATGVTLAEIAAKTGIDIANPAAVTAFLANSTAVDAALAQFTWNGERLFDAARVITESEYNHVAIDQYVGGLVALPEFVSYSGDVNMSVSLEFSQAVFRLGHSQLTEQLQFSVTDANGVNPGEPGYVPTYQSENLFDAFLAPGLYQEYGAAGIAMGLISQTGNELDEFVTPGLQQTLLGQSLDLASFNIARGRDVGLPTLNELRQQVTDGLAANNPNINGSALAPYQSWSDFGAHLRNEASLVNFIAAYGEKETGAKDWGLKTARDAYLAGDSTVTLASIREKAQHILDASVDTTSADYAAARAFLGLGVWTPDPLNPLGDLIFNNGGAADLGFWDIDLWLGGLAERPLFDGPLGTTFSFIMLDFGQRMQDGDRFYYLYRMPVGQHLGDQIIAEQFKDIVERSTGLEHLNGDVFGNATETYILDNTKSDYFVASEHVIPGFGNAASGHIVVAGLAGNDKILGGLGDDTLYGDAGNDELNGSQGNDHLYGGDGDDLIKDDENDDFLSGGAGNDRLFAGPGVLDTSHGNDGDDEVHGGDGVDEVFGDDGDDRLYGEGDTDLIIGGEGNDFMEGGDSVDEMFGGNGNDWMRGGVGDDNVNGGSGNDLMEGGLGPTANDGDRLNGDTPLTPGVSIVESNGDGTEGDMDIVSYEHVNFAIIASLQTANANGTSSNLRDTYAFDEGLVGSRNNDTLTGADANGTAGNGVNNYLVGGAGADKLVGLGGDDFIFGDRAVVDNHLYWIGDARHLATGHGAVVGTNLNWYGTGDDRPVFADGSLGHILGDNADATHGYAGGGASGSDVAVFQGNAADYTIEFLTIAGENAVKITDNGGVLADGTARANLDGTDILVGVELAQFADQTISIVATPPTLDLHAFDPSNLADNFTSAAWNNSHGTSPWASSWVESGDTTTGNAVTGGQIQLDAGNGGGSNQLRFNDNADGASIQRVVDLAGATSAVVNFSVNRQSFDNGETVVASFTADASAAVPIYHTLRTITANSDGTLLNGGDLLALLGPGEALTANAAIKFEAFTSATNTGGSSNNGYIAIDNLTINLTKPSADASLNYATTFTENGAAVAIAYLPGITDDSPTMESAKIVLKDAKPGDVLAENGINGDGITGTVTPVGADLVLTLTGTATLAQYQAAIGRVTFSNTSDTPDAAPRTIEVTVNDGRIDSNIATTTVTVVPVDDPTDANGDSVVTNFASGTLIIPEWALLANDVDPDTVLDITGVTENSSRISNLSLATNPGAVTLSYDGSGNGNTGATFNYTLNNSSQLNALVSVNRDTTGTVDGGNGRQILVGDGASSTFAGGAGNDIVLAGGGNDTINWSVGPFGSDGQDFVDGGTGTDTFTLTSTVPINFFTTAGNETFNIYTKAAAEAAGFIGLNDATEIVITRNGQVAAELDNVEEIVINTGPGTNQFPANTGTGDKIFIHGDFTATSLLFSTITIIDEQGGATVDISDLTSEHRIVLHTDENGKIEGATRPQDLVDRRASTGNGGTNGDTDGTDDGDQVEDAHDDADEDYSAGSDVGSQGNGDTGPDPAAPITPSATALVLNGTSTSEALIGGAGDDTAAGAGGDDTILLAGGSDTASGGDGADTISGGAGDDLLLGDGDHDILLGGAGDDMILGGLGDDRVIGEAGADTLDGGKGHDVIEAGDGNDRIIAGRFDGDDVIDGGAGFDTIDLSAITDALKIKLGQGGFGSAASGQVGSDTLRGIENVIAGAGDDEIAANDNVNVMTGGLGNDTFVFFTIGSAQGDTISDFRPGDRMDLSAIDANASLAGDQNFVLLDQPTFTAAGQVLFRHEQRADGAYTVLEGDVDGDKSADFSLSLVGTHHLKQTDFI